jgi:hypothetical protein
VQLVPRPRGEADSRAGWGRAVSGRIRTIKPEILEDEECASLSDEAWRLWVSVWCLADDHGNARSGDKYLAAQVWQDSGRSPRISAILRELCEANRVVLYTHGPRGERYIHIQNWGKHQRVDNAGKPRVPGPSDPGSTRIQILADGSAENLGDSPQPSETLGDPRLARLRAPLSAAGPTTPISDPDPEHDPPRVCAHARDQQDQQDQVEGAAIGSPASLETTPEAERVAIEDLDAPASQETAYDFGCRIWGDEWAKAKGKAYGFLGPMNRHEGEAMRFVAKFARDRGGDDAEKYLRHWLRQFFALAGYEEQQGHPIGLFKKNINRFSDPTKKSAPKPPSAPADEPVRRLTPEEAGARGDALLATFPAFLRATPPRAAS